MKKRKILFSLMLIVICLIHNKSLATTSTITYETNGGFFTYSPSLTYVEGNVYNLPSNVYKAGYIFEAWYEDSTFSGEPVTQISSTSTGNKTYYAKWNLNVKAAEYKEIVGGMYHTLAMTKDGFLVGWGVNNNGQLGYSSSLDDVEMIEIKSGTKFIEMSAGGFFSLAIDENGSLWAMGANGVGQLGTGDTKRSATPVNITNTDGTAFKKVSAGMAHSLAIDENGTLWAWGNNDKGQLGTGDTTNSLVPVKIMSGTKFKEIAAGGSYSLAIDENGTLYSWGENNNGELGLGNTTDTLTPTVVGTIKFKKIVASIGEGHSLAIDENGYLYSWGDNTYGQLGTSSTTSETSPTAIMSGIKVKEIEVGYNNSFAITEDGKLYGWGANASGELGDGTKTLRTSPVLIKEKMSKVAANWNHTVGIDTEGIVYAWGANEYGELLDGTIVTKTRPVAITSKDAEGVFTIEHYKQKDTLDGYELVTEDVEISKGIVGAYITATEKKYDGYILNTRVNGTITHGKIPSTGGLTLKLYYDKILEYNFNICLNNQNGENGIGIQNTKYDILIKYSNGEEKEYTDQITDSEGNISISNIYGRNNMTIYITQNSIETGYAKDYKKHSVGIRVNVDANGIELYGNKTSGIEASVEGDTLYVVHTNNYINSQNSIRLNVVDGIDNDITIQNTKFEITYPNGKSQEVETNADGIAEISNLIAPGKGDFLFEIIQKSQAYGYNKISDNIYLNINFDENGIIANVSVISGDATAEVINEVEGTKENVIANINIQQQRDTTGGLNGPFGEYKIKIIEEDIDTNEKIEGVRYKVIQKATTSEISNVITNNKTTNSDGETLMEALDGEKLLLTLKRSKVPEGYKFDRSELQVELIKNAEGNYELVSDVDGVTIDETTKIITIKRTNYLKSSLSNISKSKVNNTLYITKVDEELRPLKGVIMELRENSSGTKWKLKTDENGLAKLTNEDLIKELGSVFPQYLTQKEGMLTFWITEESVPVGYERIDTDIGFEAYYEYTPEGVLEISYMNVLDGLSYYHIVDQEYDQYEEEDYMQVDIKLKVINPYSREIDTTQFNTIEIEKVDSENNNIKLENAIFKLTLNYPTEGSMTTTARTNSSGILDFNKLYFPEGTSTVEIVEISVPSGYALDKAPKILYVTNTEGTIEVEGIGTDASIDSNGKISLQIENTKEEKLVPYNFVIEKRDEETDKLISYGADFTIKISEETQTNTYYRTSVEGIASVYNLNGKGTIKIEVEEVDAPRGYKKEEGIKTVYINKSNLMSGISLLQQSRNVRIINNTVYLTIYNEKDYEDSTSTIDSFFEIEKVDSNNQKLGLKGARFKITMPNGTRIIETSKTGNAGFTLTDGISGRYIIEEINAPVGYELAKKIALDITFDSYKNVKSCNIVSGLGDEYTTSILQKSAKGKCIHLRIGDSKTKSTSTGVGTYTLHIDKVSSKNTNQKLNGAKFDIDIYQSNGASYYLSEKTEDKRGIYVSGLSGSGRIIVSLKETKAPSGYRLNGEVKSFAFTRDETTRKIVLDTNSLHNVEEDDIIVNMYGNMITIIVKDEPLSYVPVIDIDGPDNPEEVDPSDPNYGKPYNSILIENEYIRDHSVKIQGTTFAIYRLGSYISKGTTDRWGLTWISLGNTQYYTTEDYLIKNIAMRATNYIPNDDVILRITYDSNGKMQDAQIVSGEYDSEGRVAAEIDENYKYVGENRIKVDIRCDKKAYADKTGTAGSSTGDSGNGGTGGETGGETGGGSGGSGGSSGGTTGEIDPKPKIEIEPEDKPTPIKPVPGEYEPDFGIQLEKVHIFNEKIKIKDAEYAIYVYNEETGESTSKITKTNSKGQITFGGLLGFGKFEITIVEIASPGEYLIDEQRHVLKINRDEESQMITILNNDYAENVTARVDDINKIIKVTIKEIPSSIGIAVRKQDYDDDEITIKNAVFEITDTETGDVYELTTGEEGIEYINLPVKADGRHIFKVNEVQAPGGYRITSQEISLNVNYIDGIIASADIVEENEYADVITQNAEYIEISVLDRKITEGVKYDLELIKADAYYSSITFKDARIKIEVDNETGLQGVVKTSLTDEDGKIYLNDIYGSGVATIKITEIEPPPGRRFDTKEKQVVLNINEETGWIKLDNVTTNVDTFIDNDTKKVIVRIRNYPDGTFIMGANKVDANDHNLIITGAKFSVELSGGNDLYELTDYKEGLMALQDIPIPNMSGEYTYIIKEIEAPSGYILDPTPVVLKVQISLINGIKTITKAYVESGNAKVGKFGDEFVHLLLFDNFDTTRDDLGYTIGLIKVDSLNHEYIIPDTLIKIHVEAESGENYYKEVKTDEFGRINLNNIIGTGKVAITIEEIESASKYFKDKEVKTITLSRDVNTKKIIIEEIEGTGIYVNEDSGDIEIIFENSLNTIIARAITVKKIWADNDNIAGKRPESVKLQIKNGDTVIASKIVDSKYASKTNPNEWIYTFSALDKNDIQGNAINYTIDEAEVNEDDLFFYIKTINEERNEITNTFGISAEKNKTSITVKKIWDDNSNEYGKRPESIELQIKNGTTVVAKKVIDSSYASALNSNEWQYTFTDLQKFTELADIIQYTIDEKEVNEDDLLYYAKTIDEEKNEIINTFTVPKELLKVTIRKIYKGTDIGLENAEIGITPENGIETTGKTNKDGYVTFSGLEIGKTYTYREVKAPLGYTLNTEEYSFRVEGDGSITDIVGNRIIENERITANVTIVKYVEGTTIGVKGAEIGIYSEDGSLVTVKGIEMKGKTSESGKIMFVGLEPGTYYYKEITAPIGYKLNTNSYKFTVNEDGTITFENDTDGILYNEEYLVDVVIRKVYKGTTIGLKGAEITLIDDKNNEYTAITNEDGYVTFKGVQAGRTYYYKETKAPVGYELNTEEYSFRVEEDGSITDRVGNRIIENEKITTKVIITKYVQGTTIGVKGAEIGIYDEDGNLVTVKGIEMKGKTSESGKIMFVGLEPGTYCYKEITAPIGYKLNTNSYKFTVNEDGTITFENDTDGILYNEEYLIDVTIRKVYKGTTIGLKGAEITLIDDKNNEYTAITNEDGYVTFKGVQAGRTYYYKETKAPVGYKLNTEEYSFKVEEDGSITDIVGNRIIENEKIIVKVEIVKYENGTKIVVKGAEIGIYDETGKLVVIDGKELKGTTDINGRLIFEGLGVGTYYYKEITAPIGYKLNPNAYKFVVTNLGTIEFENDTNGILYDELFLIDIPIRKIDGITKLGIQGATIIVVDEEGNEKTGVTGEDGYAIFSGLQAGKTYTYKEIIAPNGYNLNTGEYKFVINADGTVTDIVGNRVIENYTISGEILVPIRKIDAITKLGIQGATITIIDEAGNETSAVTDKDGYVMFAGLKKGAIYTYKETVAPSGYKLNTIVYSFKVNEDGIITDINGNRIIENYPEEKIILVPIRKIDAITKLGIAGVKIAISDSDGNEVVATTDKDGYVTFSGLTKGKIYSYYEKIAPDGYALNPEIYYFKVNEDGSIADIYGKRVIWNYPVEEVYGIKIRKIDAITKNGVKGAIIGVYDEEGNPILNEAGVHITATTDEQGFVTFKIFQKGKIYKYKELVAPEGYQINKNIYSFKVNNNATITDIFGNRIIEDYPLGKIEISKVEYGTSKYLADTKIALYNYEEYSNGNAEPIEELITNQNGKVVFKNLKAGKYICIETKAPEGYNLDSKRLIFEVKENGNIEIKEGSVILEDTKISTDLGKDEEPNLPERPTVIPQTGSKIILPIITLNSIVLAVFYYYKKNKF